MKVLFIANALDRPERHLIQGLSKRGLEAHLLLDSREQLESIEAEMCVTSAHLSLPSRLSPQAILFIRQVVKRLRPDIVHTFSGRALSNALLATSFMNVRHVTYRGTMGNLSFWDPSSRISFLNPRIAKIICVSDAVKNDLILLGLPVSRVARIYKGHSLHWYQALSKVSRESLGFAAGTRIVVCVANSRPVKGIDVLIRAFHLIPRHIPAVLLLVGEDREGVLKSLAAADERIHFTGFRADAPAVVAACDIFCMPSRRREGFPKALLEAMIQGIPAVVSSVGGMPEMVSHGETGEVVPPEDPHQLANALIRLLEDTKLCRDYGQRAQQKVLQEFAIEKTVDETQELYSQLLKEHPIK